MIKCNVIFANISWYKIFDRNNIIFIQCRIISLYVTYVCNVCTYVYITYAHITLCMNFNIISLKIHKMVYKITIYREWLK